MTNSFTALQYVFSATPIYICSDSRLSDQVIITLPESLSHVFSARMNSITIALHSVFSANAKHNGFSATGEYFWKQLILIGLPPFRHMIDKVRFVHSNIVPNSSDTSFNVAI